MIDIAWIAIMSFLAGFMAGSKLMWHLHLKGMLRDKEPE